MRSEADIECQKPEHIHMTAMCSRIDTSTCFMLGSNLTSNGYIGFGPDVFVLGPDLVV